MMELLLLSLLAATVLPVLIALVSFAMWENGFRLLGTGYIIRMSLAMQVFAWVYFFTERGGAA